MKTYPLLEKGTKEYYLKILSQTPPHHSPEFLDFIRKINKVEFENKDWVVIRNIKYFRKNRPWLTAFSINGSQDTSSLNDEYGDWMWLKKASSKQTVNRFHIHLIKK